MQDIPNSGSTNYNYKGANSLVLMAMCDAYLRFTLVDIGAAGRQSNAGVLKHSAMGQMLQANQLNVPMPAKVGNMALFFHLLWLQMKHFH
ncbi:hypothetical protein NQ314_013928 [Rhamnusium bicolor]|uniref:DDE Tnp4 domain-containing protein n=1 Tax=Rhamnusium bicolor TaxID=1586634 RepID=A0AAV8X4G9_9CUCU|nr:hypothetical protein NQ314_013928 [Rhamnusium bicolor]